MKHIIFFLLIFCGFNVLAQENEERVEKQEGYLIGFNVQVPSITIANLNDRFGWVSQMGPSISYKSKENWLYSVAYNVMFGNRINETVGGNLINSQGLIIGTDGYIAEIQPQMTGFTLQFQAGKIININKKNLDSGILLSGGIGYMQHRINLNNSSNTTPQIQGIYAKGYDKLTNGFMIGQTISFFRIDPNKLFNFQFGIEMGQGFTKNRRDFNFDTKSAEPDLRLDGYIGLKFTIYIPAYLSAKDEYYFK